MTKVFKKIFFIIPSFRGGGAERATITIASELDKKENLDVTLIALSSEGPLRNLAKNVEVKEFEKSRARYAFFALRSLLKKQQPDIVFSTLQQANILVYLISKCTKKTWKTVHLLQSNFEEITYYENFIVSYLFKKALKNGDSIVSCSEGVIKNLRHNLDISPSRSFFIHNPVNISKVQKLSRKGVTSGVFNKHPILVGCGRLVEVKGFEYFISALPHIKERYADAQIVLLGDGPLKEDLKNKAKQLGVRDSVHFFGFVDNPYKYMRASDVFVLSSLSEGFGLVLVEALACGAKIIATDCPFGPREILRDGELGRLISMRDSLAISDAVKKVLENQDSEKEKRIKRSDDFRPEKVAKEYQSLIDKILKNEK